MRLKEGVNKAYPRLDFSDLININFLREIHSGNFTK